MMVYIKRAKIADLMAKQSHGPQFVQHRDHELGAIDVTGTSVMGAVAETRRRISILQGYRASTFFHPRQSLCRPDLALPGSSTRHASRLALSFLMEVSHIRFAHYNPVPWPVTASVVGWRPSRGRRASAAPPRKHLQTAI